MVRLSELGGKEIVGCEKSGNVSGSSVRPI